MGSQHPVGDQNASMCQVQEEAPTQVLRTGLPRQITRHREATGLAPQPGTLTFAWLLPTLLQINLLFSIPAFQYCGIFNVSTAFSSLRHNTWHLQFQRKRSIWFCFGGLSPQLADSKIEIWWQRDMAQQYSHFMAAKKQCRETALDRKRPGTIYSTQGDTFRYSYKCALWIFLVLFSSHSDTWLRVMVGNHHSQWLIIIRRSPVTEKVMATYEKSQTPSQDNRIYL